MNVLYFASARRAAGASSERFPLTEPVRVGEVWDLLVQHHPELAALRASSRLARDNDFLSSDALVHPEDEIAVIPPVSGG